MIVEVIFQTIDPTRRHEYPKLYGESLAHAAFDGCHGGKILLDQRDPAGVVILLEWESAEHHQRAIGTSAHAIFLRAIRALAIAPHGHYSYYASYSTSHYIDDSRAAR
jgi:hypothetical protein